MSGLSIDSLKIDQRYFESRQADGKTVKQGNKEGYLRGGIGNRSTPRYQVQIIGIGCPFFQATLCNQSKRKLIQAQFNTKWNEKKEVLQIPSNISLGPSTTLNHPQSSAIIPNLSPIPHPQSCPGPGKPEKAYVTSRRTTATKDAEAGD